MAGTIPSSMNDGMKHIIIGSTLRHAHFPGAVAVSARHGLGAAALDDDHPPDAIRVGADWRFDRLSVSRPYVSMISC
jgi:hypothetical protein